MGESREQDERRTAVRVLVDRGVNPRQAMDLAGVHAGRERLRMHLQERERRRRFLADIKRASKARGCR